MAYVNFFHTMTTDIDISAKSKFMLEKISTEKMTPYYSLHAGIQQLEIIQKEKRRALLLPLIKHQYYTLFIMDDFHCFLVPNDTCLHQNESNIRFINIFSSFSPIDIAVSGGDVLFHQIPFQSLTDFLFISPMTIDLEIRFPKTKQVIMKLPSITCSPNRSHTIIITPTSYQNIISSHLDGVALLTCNL